MTNSQNYIVGWETADESARLRFQGSYFDSQLGLLPEGLPLTMIKDVLDIGCASGGWACALASKYPSKLTVTGIDISEKMIDAAQARTFSDGLPQVSFRVMNATHYPLDFKPNSFDFIHARAICAFMQTTYWPALVQECSRLLRPGGYLCFVESDAQGWTTSPALAEFYRFGHLALYENGNSWEKEGVGITARLPLFLKEAGFVVLSNQMYRLDLGRENPDGYNMGVRDYRILLRDVVQFYVKAGVAKKEELDLIYQQALKEIESEDFNAYWVFTRILGKNDG